MSSISAGTTTGTALVQTGDTTGNLVIKTGANATTALTISGTDQSATFAGAVSFSSNAFAAGSASAPSITFTGDTNTGIFSPGADTIAFTEGGTESMRIDSSGNLGIGATSLTNAVTTYRGAGVNNYIQFTNATTGTASTDGCLIGVAADDTALRLRVLEAAPMIFTTTDTERMRIAANGAIGIGGTNYGTSGQVLTSGGSGAAPSWTTISSTPTTAQVLSATAGATAGDVGTYAFLYTTGSYVNTFFNGTRAGSGLRAAGVYEAGGGSAYTNAASTGQSGTWKCMGLSNNVEIGNFQVATLWLRIS